MSTGPERPLLYGYVDGAAICAWRRGRAITVDAFLADVETLAAALPERGHVLNVALDRYRFVVGVAAAALRGQINLLPPSTHGATIRQLVARFPDLYCLAETPQADIDLPQTSNDRADGTSARRDVAMPSFPDDQTIAYVFTSGSTGVPTMHRKRWGALVVNVRSEAERLECAAGTPPIAIVATVPPQHMYGFESSVMMPLQSGHALVAERPFYPADVTATLAALPGRRMLVTTPVHLRAWLAAAESTADALPRVEVILCATAPLATTLADATEHATGAPVLEIYGCTETGQLASRRPAQESTWQTLGDIRLHQEADRTIASGGHIEEPTALADVIDLVAADPSRRFTLSGRTADLVNIAGKRTSLGHLNVQLNAIDGVIDGVFIAPDTERADGVVTRLSAVVVAPTLDAPRVLAALRQRIDPVFLPRPLHFVDRLPRNATGKVTLAALQALLHALPSNTQAAASPVPHARLP